MTHGTIIAVFVIIAAVALAIQAVALVSLFVVMWRVQKQVSEIGRDAKKKIDEVAQAILDIISTCREPAKNVAANLAEISRMARERTGVLDAALADVMDKTRFQLLRLDELVSSLYERVETTAAAVQRGVLGPLGEVSAIGRGVQTALDFFFSRRRPSPSTVREATQDEEMFI